MHWFSEKWGWHTHPQRRRNFIDENVQCLEDIHHEDVAQRWSHLLYSSGWIGICCSGIKKTPIVQKFFLHEPKKNLGKKILIFWNYAKSFTQRKKLRIIQSSFLIITCSCGRHGFTVVCFHESFLLWAPKS